MQVMTGSDNDGVNCRVTKEFKFIGRAIAEAKLAASVLGVRAGGRANCD